MPATAQVLALCAALLIGGAAVASEAATPGRLPPSAAGAQAAGASICAGAIRVANCVQVCTRKVGNTCVSYETRCRGTAGARG